MFFHFHQEISHLSFAVWTLLRNTPVLTLQIGFTESFAVPWLPGRLGAARREGHGARRGDKSPTLLLAAPRGETSEVPQPKAGTDSKYEVWTVNSASSK